MRDYLLDRYCAGTLTSAQLATAVRMRWVTAADAETFPAECERRAQAVSDTATITDSEEQPA